MSEVKPRRPAGALDNGDFICIETFSGYRMSRRDPDGAQHLLPPDASDEALGEASHHALARSRFLEVSKLKSLFELEVVQQVHSSWLKNVMDRYGYKTKRALFKNMKNCKIQSLDDKITIRPTNHEKLEGWSGDGINKDDYVVIAADSSPAQVGAALRLAFNRCI